MLFNAHLLPYGLWPSPLTPAALAQGRRLSDLAWDSDGRRLVWLEGRSDRGVAVVAGLEGDAPRDLGGALSIRARVGYGGGNLTAAHEQLYFVAEGRLYRQSLTVGEAKAITPAFGDAAAPAVSPDGRWLLYVHSYEGVDGLAVVDCQGTLWPQKLIFGDDFYMQPVWHPAGRHIAWVSWNFPQMPWDGATLGLARLEFPTGGAPVVAERAVVAGDRDTAVFQPSFSPDGRFLAYVSDVSGWDNLYLYELATGRQIPLVEGAFEVGLPAWAQGMRTYAWSPDGATVYYLRNEAGAMRLWQVDVASKRTAPVAALSAYTHVAEPAVAAGGEVAVIASAPQIPPRVLVWDPASDRVRIMARAEGESVPAEALSRPQAITWSSAEGEIIHGIYYPPVEGAYRGAGKPPLIVMVHGGPTGQAFLGYSARNQFFATRGYAVLDVNYRGSSGYGRAYRNRLRERWGIYDVDDAVSGARHLAGQGLVDANRMVIMGGSAGGYTVLMALIRYPGTFKAGICLYGVTNLFTLAADTHKFEQRYLDGLVGPLPEAAQRYRERSPIFCAERIQDPVAIFQGEEDRVVPKAQAETIVEALRRNRVPHEYHLYPGEGHGWRKSETIETFYQTVLTFLRQYVLFA